MRHRFDGEAMDSERIQFLLDNLQESLEVEVKNWLNGLRDAPDKAKLAKEIIALGNNGGGYIFVGFDDQGTEFPEVEPTEGEFEAFTQDTVAEIVERYVMPPCQCRVEYYVKSGGEQQHPVILVPGEHRTPLWANRGSEGKGLENGKVYVRRPGGKSEIARNQDDWEKLIDRLVRARQSEILSAIREVLEPSSKSLLEENSSLEMWTNESYNRWKALVSDFDHDDPRRLEKGHWIASFTISPFVNSSLADLNELLSREMPKFSGWPPFTYIHQDPIRPEAHGDVIEAYLGYLREDEGPIDRVERCDFWRISKDGSGFLLRPMQEDREGYLANWFPRPKGPFFDWTLPIYRTTELLKFVEKLGLTFGSKEATFHLLLRYCATKGRQLEQHSLKYNLFDEGACRTNSVESRIEGNIGDIALGVEEIVYSVLVPVYEQFDFAKLPKALVNNIVQEALGHKR